MIKKLKIGLLVAVLSLGIGVANSASAAAVTYDIDTVITINSNNYTILGGSAATSVVLDTTTLTVEVPASTTFTLISSGRHTLANDGGLTATCTNGESRLAISTASTVIITPSTTACGAITSGGGGSGGGGYTSTTSSTTSTVAQSATPVTVQVTPTITMVTDTPGCSGGNKYNTSTGALCVSSTVSTGNVPGCGNRTSGFSTATGGSCAGNVVGSSQSSYNFGTTTLKNGSKGNAVMELQRFLNAKLNLGLVVDGKLGPKTIAVIKKWQKDNGLVADGLIGAKTKAKMNAQAQ